MLRYKAYGRRWLSQVTEWHVTEIKDRKSVFEGRHVPLNDPKLIPEILEQLLHENKRIAKNASHPHIIAWRTGEPVEVENCDSICHSRPKSKNNRKLAEAPPAYCNVQQGFKDNGEKGGGEVLLEQVIRKNGLYNVLVIVTRWYGGVKLGSVRFRHIASVAVASLREGNRI